MIRVTCRLCGVEFVVHPKEVRPTRTAHDREAHLDVEAQRQRVVAEVLQFVTLGEQPGRTNTCAECGFKTFGDPAHTEAHGAMTSLADEFRALEDHWDYVDLDGPRWPVFER